MYGVLLAALLTSGGQQTQGFHPRGACYGSCYGSSFGSCSGSSGHGGGHFGRSSGGGLFSGLHGGSSVTYGSYGGSGFTGYTVGYSNWASGCYGSSCFGGCYGTAGIGCFGYSGGFAVPGVTVPQFTEGEYQPQNYAPPVQQGVFVPPSSSSPPPAPVVPPAAPFGDKSLPVRPLPDLPKIPGVPPLDPLKQINATITNEATVVMHVPADAKVWVDKVLCPLTGSTRSFQTPSLLPGAVYGYTIAVEMPDGSREERRIAINAGRTVEVDFRGMGIETVRK